MSLFERPHRLMSVSSVVMELKPETLREVDDYAVWMEKLRAELVKVYGEGAMSSDVVDITYATSDHPNRFSSRITESLFERLRDYKALLGKADSVNKEMAETTQLQQLIESAINENTEGAKALRQKRRELRNVKENMARLTRQAAELKYQLTCFSQQLTNVFNAEAVRVSFA
ncbi:hypothetical protein, conserved [Leishmania tarentolae]|uniref:Uncharacterized protein n=1 Tax=Leishmania tarentolae TaxID=5689 RepID=A0A640KUI9_LEITA|nr:hypothetical protein, conserved [Leishmania tarentolae]